jgi:lysozyme family protein
MIVDYNPFVERMISRYEGGYGWDREDKGGPTKYGVTCWDLAKHRHQVMNNMAVWAPIVKAMPLSEADDIYDVDYAVPMDFNQLGPGKDCVVFDTGVNSGVSRSVKFAQRIVGTTADGVVGPITLAAVNAYDPANFINQFCTARLEFLRGLGAWDHFGGGWSARVADLRVYSLNLASTKAKARIEGPIEKLQLIPLAFAKGYDMVPAN